MKKTLLAASLLAMIGGTAQAATITVKYEHKLLDGRTTRPKVEFSHRMDNGLQLGFENAWQIDRSESRLERSSGFAPEQYEMTFKSDYQYRWGERNSHQAGGVLDYQWKEETENIRYGLYYGYRWNKELNSKFRARISENIGKMKNGEYRDSDQYNKEWRFDHWLTYRTGNWQFVWDFIYLKKISDYSGNVYDNNKRDAIENEFSAEYRLPNARAHAFYGKFKLKQKLNKSSHETDADQPYNWLGRRDNALEVGYKYRF